MWIEGSASLLGDDAMLRQLSPSPSVAFPREGWGDFWRAWGGGEMGKWKGVYVKPRQVEKKKRVDSSERPDKPGPATQPQSCCVKPPK